jgi:type I restriction enzyme S subunit
MSELVNGISSTGRTKVTLGEIARNVSENEYKPKDKGLDRCVGLEHLDPGSLKIRRWSPITLEMSFTRRFYKGQILFGKRRAYQKKVALAEFDGICSSDILVIEAKKENFVPELLPFIIQDDRFFEYAVGTSSGSLSPRTKWKFIADYEILLPSLGEQRRVATTLWAAEDCIVKGEGFVAAAERAKQVLMQELFSKGIGHTELKDVKGFGKVPKEWEVIPFQNLYAEPSIIGLYKGAEFIGRGFKLVKMTEFFKGDILGSECADRMEVSENEQKKYSLKSNDLLFGRRSLNIEGAGKCVLVPKIKETLIFESSIIRTTLNQKIASPYFYLSYFNGWGRSQIKRIIRSVAASGITSTDLASLLVPKPPLPEQHQIAGILTRCDETIAAARANTGAAKALKMKMINEMLSPEIG